MPDTHAETRDFDPGQLLGESMHREIAAGARLLESDGETTVDADRAVEMELAFSSEAPVERYWGKEILGHREDEIDLNRLRNGAPLLIDHDNRLQLPRITDLAEEIAGVHACADVPLIERSAGPGWQTSIAGRSVWSARRGQDSARDEGDEC